VYRVIYTMLMVRLGAGRYTCKCDGTHTWDGTFPFWNIGSPRHPGPNTPPSTRVTRRMFERSVQKLRRTRQRRQCHRHAALETRSVTAHSRSSFPIKGYIHMSQMTCRSGVEQLRTGGRREAFRLRAPFAPVWSRRRIAPLDAPPEYNNPIA
jgi:hypothetical protein